MAIYHMEAKVISQGAGHSAVAAAAYMSCSKITNDYDGVTHDYTRKQGLVWQAVFLPPMASAKWRDRAVLWNAVEEAEKAKDSRLAREFVVALPLELDWERWQTLIGHKYTALISGNPRTENRENATIKNTPTAQIPRRCNSRGIQKANSYFRGRTEKDRGKRSQVCRRA